MSHAEQKQQTLFSSLLIISSSLPSHLSPRLPFLLSFFQSPLIHFFFVFPPPHFFSCLIMHHSLLHLICLPLVTLLCFLGLYFILFYSIILLFYIYFSCVFCLHLAFLHFYLTILIVCFPHFNFYYFFNISS